MASNKKVLIWLYVVFIYILAFTIWWARLLFTKNQESYVEKIELLAMQNEVSKEEFLKNENSKDITKKFKRQELMIYTEGSAFIVLIVIGFVLVRRSIVKELTLAERQKNFILSITHEFKSPLASVKLVQQTLQKHELNEAQKNKLIDNSLYDLERLTGLVDNMLLAAKFEGDLSGFSLQEIDLSKTVESILKRYQVIKKKNVEIVTRIQADLVCMADPAGIMSLVVNLVDNAIKYSDESSSVYVELSQTQNQILLMICDTGYGIPTLEKKRIFDKFYRIGSEETRKSKGTGLGLYIVKNIVALHKGVIEVKDNQPKGTKFIVYLPSIQNLTLN